MNLLSVENLSKNYGEKALFQGISFGIDQGQKVALVARNGSGKTTLLKILFGKDTPDEGSVVFRKDIRLGFLEQDTVFDDTKTILETILGADEEAVKVFSRYLEFAEKSTGEEVPDDLVQEMTRLDGWNMEGRIKQILGKLGLEDTSKKVGQLSGGQKKRLALATVLISDPEFIILDEPTNHLDIEMIEWLEGFLGTSDMTILMVTHDRYFLDDICDEILELDNGNLYRYKGNYSYFLDKKAEREENLQAEIARAKNTMRKELEWIRRQPKARGTKAKARVDAFDSLKEKASQRIKKDELNLRINSQRMGGKILEIHRLKKAYGSKVILDGFDYTFLKGEKLGIVGPNGVGKSTFLKMIMGQEQPDGGKIVTGETVVMGYYSQDGMINKDDLRVIEVIREIAEYIPLAGGKKIYAAQMLERFLFPAPMHYQYVSKLSGGEKRRLYLLTILMKNPNFLILDEPTNDLDIFTLSALEDYLEYFEGCVLVITHDRYFMDRVVDHILVFEGDGKVKDILGNYTLYRETKKEEATEDKKLQKEKDAGQPAKSSPSTEKKKISFKEKFEFEQLDKEIPELEARKAEMEERMASLTDHEELLKESEKLSRLMDDIEAKTLRWMELADLMSGS